MAENSEQVLWASYKKLYINDDFWWGGWLGKGGRRTMFMSLYYVFVFCLQDDYAGQRRTREVRAGCVDGTCIIIKCMFMKSLEIIIDSKLNLKKLLRSYAKQRYTKSIHSDE